MAQLTVTLIRADTNQEFEVELPDDVRLESLLPQLVEQLGLPLVGPTGDRILYELSNKRTGAAYQENDTLSSQNTKNGDLILLTSTFVAGRDPAKHGPLPFVAGRDSAKHGPLPFVAGRNPANNRAAPQAPHKNEALVGGLRSSSRDKSNALASQDPKSKEVPFLLLGRDVPFFVLPLPLALALLP